MTETVTADIGEYMQQELNTDRAYVAGTPSTFSRKTIDSTLGHKTDIFVVLFSPSRQIPGQYLDQNIDRFLTHTFEILTRHSSSYYRRYAV
jgi:hypothetical protein